ncbi:MAG: TIGR03759 family integrating conjugative element protein [Pseudomonadota bacterium]
MIKSRLLSALIILAPFCGPATAFDVSASPGSPRGPLLSAVQHTDWSYGQQEVTAEDRIKRIEQLARRWEVTPEEWTRYETVMQGEGRYQWKDVDPIMVLGIYARNTQELERYAVMMAKKEYRLQSQFIAFNQAYMQAFDALYGGEPIIDLASFYEQFHQAGVTSSIKSFRQAQAIPDDNALGDRYVLFLNTQCARCDDWFSRIRTRQMPGTVLDIYFIGESEASIGSWANDQALDPSDLQGGTITLNMDNGMYAQYGRPALPAAYYYDDSSQSISQIQDEGVIQ